MTAVGAVRRRDFLRGGVALVGLGLVTGCALRPRSAEEATSIPRVGYLSGAGGQERFEIFRQGLEEHGYVVGRTITVEFRDAEGQLDRISMLAAELVRLPVDVLVADGSSEVRAAIVATATIPIVMAQSASPVEEGFVASLARPGGNVTGLTGASRELIPKRLELIKTALPGVSRVGVIWNPAIADRAGEFRIAEAAAGAFGLELRSIEVTDPAAIEAAFDDALREGVEVLQLLDNIVLTGNQTQVGALARMHRLPMMSSNRGFAAAGGLLAWGADRPALARRAATYVDKILKGANPGDLPIERPAKFELVNLKTAQALGLDIPQSILTQATEVIQ